MMLSKKQFTNRTDWLTERQKGIGGSDVAALFEISPWLTKIDLANSKLNPVTQVEETPITGMGHRMERVIFEDFVIKDFPDAKSYDDMMYVNDEIPYLQASPDAVTNDTLIEIKFVSLNGSAKWKNEEGNWHLPQYYWMQCQHYMAVMNLKKAVLYAFMQDMNDVIKFDIEFDETFITDLRIKAVEFMESLSTLKPEPIALNQTNNTYTDVRLKDLHSVKTKIKELTITKKNLEEDIKNDFEDGSVITCNKLKGKIISRKNRWGTYNKIIRIS